MSSLKRAIADTKEFLHRNPDADDEDTFEDLMSECGQTSEGGCMLAGTEYCDWECPFS